MHLTCLSRNPIQLDSGLDIIIFNTKKKVFVNNNDIEEEKLCRLISTEIYTTFISNKKLLDPKKKNPNFNKINQHNKMSFSVDLKF